VQDEVYALLLYRDVSTLVCQTRWGFYFLWCTRKKNHCWFLWPPSAGQRHVSRSSPAPNQPEPGCGVLPAWGRRGVCWLLDRWGGSCCGIDTGCWKVTCPPNVKLGSLVGPHVRSLMLCENIKVGNLGLIFFFLNLALMVERSTQGLEL